MAAGGGPPRGKGPQARGEGRAPIRGVGNCGGLGLRNRSGGEAEAWGSLEGGVFGGGCGSDIPWALPGGSSFLSG